MKALLVSAAAVGLFAAAPAFAQAGAPASATATADAVIVQPISIVKNTDLNFGRIAPNATSSIVFINNDGTRTSSAPSVLIAGGATPSIATFTISGEKGLAYSVTRPATVTLTGPAGSTAMVATLGLGTAAGGGTLDATTGTASFSQGGALAVGGNQAPGAYSGSFAVSVQYN